MMLGASAVLSILSIPACAGAHVRGQAGSVSLAVPNSNPKHIADVEANLELAREWMSISANPNASFSMFVAVKDAPMYYECGLTMNTAWGALSRDPCSAASWEASDKMKAMGEQCSKLRYGEKYLASYQALKHDQDTWCGPPSCKPACMEGVKCFRSHEFPFDPICERYPTTAPPTKPPTKSAARDNQGKTLLLALFALGVYHA